MSRPHHCHALNCETSVPPRMHMCRKHWAMVPKAEQRALWANYRRGQERDMSPSAAYLRAAAACVEAVARKESQPDDEIEFEVALYVGWAEAIEAESQS